ncbi:hypothetical protein ACVWY3_004209 [Bradyrhizobium sp. USDA 4486]
MLLVGNLDSAFGQCDWVRTAFERTHFAPRVCPNDRACIPQTNGAYVRDFWF